MKRREWVHESGWAGGGLLLRGLPFSFILPGEGRHFQTAGRHGRERKACSIFPHVRSREKSWGEESSYFGFRSPASQLSDTRGEKRTARRERASKELIPSSLRIHSSCALENEHANQMSYHGFISRSSLLFSPRALPSDLCWTSACIAWVGTGGKCDGSARAFVDPRSARARRWGKRVRATRAILSALSHAHQRRRPAERACALAPMRCSIV